MRSRVKLAAAAAISLAVIAGALYYFPNPVWSTNRLIRGSNSGNSLHRLISVGLLKDRASGSEKVLPALLLALGDDWDEVRGSASVALCGMGAVAVPRLERALKDENPQVREMAGTTLSCIRSPSK